MSQRKPYNPNTAYGRRKMREASQQYRASLPPEERKKLENQTQLWGCIIVVVIAIIVLLIGVATGNEKGALRWLSH